MRYIGWAEGDRVILEMSINEARAIGVEISYERGSYVVKSQQDLPNVLGLQEAMRKIERAKPDLKQIRATMQAFLSLTEPEAVAGVLAECGVAKPIDDAEQIETPVTQEELEAFLQEQQRSSEEMQARLQKWIALRSGE